MKKLVLTVVIFAVSQIGYAQLLTTNDMMKILSCKELNCAKDYITAKDFSFDKIIPYNSTADMYLYMSDSKVTVNEMTTKNSCVFTVSGNELTNVGYRTADKKNYLQVFEEFKRLGYKATKTSNNNDKIVTSYRSDIHKGISLEIITEKLQKGQLSWTSYDFELFKNQ